MEESTFRTTYADSAGQFATNGTRNITGSIMRQFSTDIADTFGNQIININTQTGDYTLVITDAGKMVRMNVGSANNLTVPPNSSVAFGIGASILISQAGAGQTTIVEGAGVTVNSQSAYLKIAAQYGGAALVKVATDEWDLYGLLSA